MSVNPSQSPLMFFGVDQAERLTGLSQHQLRYFDISGFFPPGFMADDPGRAYSRVYSFRDVVGLRAVAQMRNAGVSLQELRKFGEWLHDNYQDPWATLPFFVVGKHVQFEDPATKNVIFSKPPGQIVMRFNMGDIAHDVDHVIEMLRKRAPEQIGHVTQSRHVMHNSPVLAGTRIPTAAIWDFNQAGYSVEAIIEQYPSLTCKDVEAAIKYEQDARANRKRAS